ncbi:MAG: hypothetical protein R2942_20205 [Ignavibacteria bacterium]
MLNGYATSWFGKDHNVPTLQNNNTGPYSQWPIRVWGLNIFTDL